MVFHPELPIDCFISLPSGAQPEGLGTVSLCPQGLLILGRDLSLFLLRALRTLISYSPVNSYTGSVFVIVFSPQRKMVIEDETEFCGEELLHSMLKCKVRVRYAGLAQADSLRLGKGLFLGGCFVLWECGI